jgi:hypothetical protein
MELKVIRLFDRVVFKLAFFRILFGAQVHGFFVLYHLILAQNHQILCLKFEQVIKDPLHEK